MPRSERVLYASFLRLFRQYRCEGVPLTGVAGSSITLMDAGSPSQCLKRLFRNPRDLDVEKGLRLLSILRSQLDTLVASEEETRQALAEWEQLIAGQANHKSTAQPAAAALAAEKGMQLLVQQSSQLDELFSVGEFPPEESEEEDSRLQPVSLDSLAAEVLQRHAQLAQPAAGLGLPPAAAAVAREEETLAKAHSLAEVLYRHHKYQYRPFEWVYEGLEPLLLPEVLKRRKGAPLALAVLAASVGHRAGLRLIPLPAAQSYTSSGGREGPLGADNAALLDQVAPHLAAKLSGAAQGGLALQEAWLLRIEGSQAGSASVQEGSSAQQQQLSGSSGEGCHYMDASTGEIMGPQEAASKFPAVDWEVDWGERSRLVVWQALVRTIVQAHQRRGESDLVAHWTYVLLALDTQAEEWQFMLQHGVE